MILQSPVYCDSDDKQSTDGIWMCVRTIYIKEEEILIMGGRNDLLYYGESGNFLPSSLIIQAVSIHNCIRRLHTFTQQDFVGSVPPQW